MPNRVSFFAGLVVLGIESQLGCSPKPKNYNAAIVPPHLQPDGEAFVTGRRILKESQTAYRNLDFYSGTIEVTGTAGYEGGKRPITERFFKVEYQSPNFLRFEGTDTNSDPLTIQINEQKTELRSNAEIEGFASAEEALYAYGGVTFYGSLYLPGFLLDISWKNEEPNLPRGQSFLTAWATKAQLAGSAKIDEEDCHRLICERDTVTWTIYVSKKSSLVRGVDFSVSETQMHQLAKHGWGGGASGMVISMNRSYVFQINKLTLKPRGESQLPAQPATNPD